MQVAVLGSLRVTAEGREVVVPGAMPRRLLALLASRVGREVTVDALVDGLWGARPPQTASTTVQSHVARLRRALPDPQVVVRSPAGYLLQLASDALDAEQFAAMKERAGTEVAAGELDGASRLLADALDLWRGPAYAEFGDCDPLRLEAAAWETLRLEAVVRKAEIDLARPDGPYPSPDLERLVAQNPTREDAWALLMRSLYQEGRQADALDAYQRARRSLVEQLGVEPGQDLREIHQQVLAQAPHLDAPRRRVTISPSPGRAHTERDGLPMAERRHVTILTLDLDVHWTGADDDLSDPETLESMLDALRGEVSRRAAEFGGVTQAVMASRCVIAFGIPSTHEDDVTRALLAAVSLREALGPSPEGPLRRAGLATGMVVVTEGRVSGSVLDNSIAAAESGREGEITVDAGARRAVAHVARFREDSPWARLESIVEAPLVGRPVSSRPFVGRSRELALLRAGFTAASDGHLHVVTVSGEAGIGKSRLADEFVRDLPVGVTRVRGQCLPYGDRTVLAPIPELLATSADDQAAGGVSRRETLAAWTAQLDARFGGRPGVLLVEDVHWGSEVLLDFISEVVTRLVDRPLLVMVTARPEFWSQRHWPPALVPSLSVHLRPLDERHSAQLVDSVLGKSNVPRDVRMRLVERSAGIPLYAEELAALVAAPGPHSAEDVPLLLTGVLEARLDSLDPVPRGVLQCASVLGEAFTTAQLRDLAPDVAIEESLQTLILRGFVTPAGDAYRIVHELVQQVAYGRLTRLDRARLHQKAAQWWQRRAGDRFELFAEQIGHHAAQAFEDATAVGDGERAADVQDAAARGLLTSGESLMILDVPAALRLLQRADALTPEGSPLWFQVRTRLAETLSNDGRFEECLALVEPLTEDLEARRDPLVVDAAVAMLLAQFNLGRNMSSSVQALERAGEALPQGIHAARAVAMVAMAQVMGQTSESMAAAVRSAEEALRLGSLDGVELAVAHMARGRARLALGDSGGLDELEQAMHHVTAHDPGIGSVGGRQWLAGAYHHWRGPEAELVVRQQLAQMADTHGLRSLVSMGRAEEVRVLAELGRLREAVDLADHLDIGAQAQLRWAVVQRALALLDLDELDMESVDRVVATPGPEPGDLRHVMGTALVLAGAAARHGDRAAAAQALEALGELGPFLDRDGAVELFPRLVRTAHTIGEPDLVTAAVGLEENGTPLRAAVVATVRGLLALGSADLDRAHQNLHTAVSGWRRLGHVYELAYALAAAALVAAPAGSRAGPISDGREEESLFVGMGMSATPWDMRWANQL